jgi:outer membrane protein
MSDRRFTKQLMTAAVWLLSSVLVPVSALAQAQAPAATPTPASTQTTELPPIPPGPLTLDQVLSLAEPRSEAVSIAVAAVRRAEGDQVRAQSGLRPQLSAAASYDRALASEFDGVFDEIDTGPACPPFALNPTAGIDARVAEIERAIDCGAIGGGGGFFGSTGDLSNLPFGRKNTWRASLSFSQNLWSGGRNGAQIALASAGHETAQLGLTTTRAQLLFEVAQAYYDAVLSEQLVNIAAATLEQAGATLRQVEAGLNAGTQPEFEVLRARVNRDQQQPILIRQRVNRALAYLRLKRLLDLPPEADLQLANTLEDENLPPPPTFVARVSSVENALRSNEAADLSITSGLSMPARTAIDQARATVRTREASLQLIEAQKMPGVSLNSNYARIAYPDNVAAPTFDRSNWSVGISMSVPVLTGGRQRGDEAVAKAELEQSLLQQRQMEELAALDTRSAWAELLAARVAWESTAGTVQQANRAYEIADVRYSSGVSTQLELSDARVQRQQAEANRAVAARDLQVARAKVALLPDLPVGNAIPGAAPIIPQQTTPGATPVQPAPQNNGQFRNASAQFTQPQAGTQ